MDSMLPFSAEHESFRAYVRAFAAAELQPRSRQWDEGAELPREAIRLLGSAGLLNILGPKSLGGQARDYVSLGIAVEELAAADISCAQIAWIQNTLSHFFPGWGDETLRSLYRGDAVLALAMSEEGAGSDVSAIQTEAVADGDDYIINGAKIHVSMMPGADVLAVSCKMATAGGKPVIGMLRVPATTAGVSSEIMEQMGARAHSLGALRFDNVRVPKAALMGGEGQGKALMYARFNVSRCMSPLAALGAANAVVKEATQFVRTKVIFGKPIGINQSISFPLVEHQTRIEAGRLLAYRALWLNDAGADASTEAAMAKWFGITISIQAINDCLPMFGANGYLKDWSVEQRLRDVMSLQFTGGTINIMKILLVRQLIGAEFAGLRS
jgi:cyclohexanecarboxyl-CoA dehydrogenase